MIKGITNSQLRTILRIRLGKLAEAEAMPDPGSGKPQERSNQLFLLAFRKGSVRQLAELIVLAETVHKYPKDSTPEYRIVQFKQYLNTVIEEEKFKIDYDKLVEQLKVTHGGN